MDIDSDGHYDISNDGLMLTVNQLRLDDGGRYQCIAYNNQGNGTTDEGYLMTVLCKCYIYKYLQYTKVIPTPI